MRLRAAWGKLTLGFWLLPGSLVTAMALLALLLVQLDRRLGSEDGLTWSFDGDADAAHSVLGSIATGFITVSGVAFSITIVTLQLVSSQYSPLALEAFLTDRGNQLVVGVFVGIVVYALLVLRVVRSGGDDAVADEFVPRLGVTVGIVLALLGLGLLVYFVHHLATAIQVSSIAESVGGGALKRIEVLYPERFAEPEPRDADALLAEWGGAAVPGVVRSPRSGYVETVEVAGLAEALPTDARLHVRVRPGDFVTPADTLVSIWPAELVDGERESRVRSCVRIGSQRSDAQDLRFGLRQLGDIALRALSPSLNDPTTGVTCVGYLRAVLEQLAGREFPTRVRRLDEDGAWLVVERASFAEHLQPLVEVGRQAADEPRVLATVVHALEQVEACARAAGAEEHAEAAVAARMDVCTSAEEG